MPKRLYNKSKAVTIESLVLRAVAAVERRDFQMLYIGPRLFRKKGIELSVIRLEATNLISLEVKLFLIFNLPFLILA